LLVLALSATRPDRSDSVNYLASWQTVAASNLGVTSQAPTQRLAFCQKIWSGRIVYRAVHAATAQQRGVRCVDDGVNAQCSDVSYDDFEPRRAELARCKVQAEAEAPCVTPLSARSFCSSPAWNISRMISQPPTNSPLT